MEYVTEWYDSCVNMELVILRIQLIHVLCMTAVLVMTKTRSVHVCMECDK